VLPRLESCLIWKKKDDVRQYVIRRQIVKEGKKPITKAPKIQRLVTPQRLQHKRERKAVKKQRYTKSRAEAEVYNALLAKRTKESREKRKAVIAKKRSVSRAQSEATKGEAKETPGQDTAKQGDKKQEKAAKGGDKKQEKGKAEPKKEAKQDKKAEQPKPQQPPQQQQPQQKDKGDKGGKGDKDKGGDKGDKGGKGGKKKKKK